MILLAALLAASAVPLVPVIEIPPQPALMDLSAIRHIQCPAWTGSGFMIADNILVTAEHVVADGCRDGATGIPLKTYYTDHNRDFALMTGKLPKTVNPFQYDCKPFQAGETYSLYGISNFKTGWFIIYPTSFLRTVDLTAIQQQDVELDDGSVMRGIWRMAGWSVPGQSGGIYLNKKTGMAVGVHNIGNQRGLAGGYSLSDTILCNNPYLVSKGAEIANKDIE